MSSGCGQLLLFVFWMIAGLFGLVALLCWVLGMPLWVAIVITLLLASITWMIVGEQ